MEKMSPKWWVRSKHTLKLIWGLKLTLTENSFSVRWVMKGRIRAQCWTDRNWERSRIYSYQSWGKKKQTSWVGQATESIECLLWGPEFDNQKPHIKDRRVLVILVWRKQRWAVRWGQLASVSSLLSKRQDSVTLAQNAEWTTPRE